MTSQPHNPQSTDTQDELREKLDTALLHYDLSGKVLDEILDIVYHHTASRVAEADDKAHLIGFKNGKFATTKRLNDLWTTIIIDDVGAEKAFAYREAIEAYLQQPKESEEL